MKKKLFLTAMLAVSACMTLCAQRSDEEEGRRALEKSAAEYDSVPKWEERKAELRSNIITALGIDRFPKTEIRTVSSNRRTYKGYRVENMALEILPGVWVSGSLYMPARYKGKIPFMLSPHGHFYNNKDNSIPDERGRYRPDQQLRCATLARMGVAVFSYDMWAWGESALAFAPKDHRTDLAIIMQTWQSVRILDYFCAQEWVDLTRVGATGASGGGSQVMIIAAIDDRVTLSAPVVMVSAHFNGGCPCESGRPVHILPDGTRTNNVEFCAAFAPKPLLIVSDGEDWTKNVPEVEFPYLQKMYGLYGAEDNVENVHLASEGHDYGLSKRLAVYDFVRRRWSLDASRVYKDGRYDESATVVEPAVEMYVFGEERKLPEGTIMGSAALRAMIASFDGTVEK